MAATVRCTKDLTEMKAVREQRRKGASCEENLEIKHVNLLLSLNNLMFANLILKLSSCAYGGYRTTSCYDFHSP